MGRHKGGHGNRDGNDEGHEPGRTHRPADPSAKGRSDGVPDRDPVLAKKRARVDLIGRLDRHSRSDVSALRLLAEVDLALSEHRTDGAEPS